MTSVAVLVCDLDGFKQVNDRFGHLEGNRLLREVATQLKDVCREYDYVARMGGDEFVVLAGPLRSDADAQGVAMKLLETVNRPFEVDGQLFGVEVDTVQEVLAYHEYTPVPLAPPAVGGLFNLRAASPRRWPTRRPGGSGRIRAPGR